MFCSKGILIDPLFLLKVWESLLSELSSSSSLVHPGHFLAMDAKRIVAQMIGNRKVFIPIIPF